MRAGRTLLAWLLGALLRGLAVTWRVRFEGSDPLADGERRARLGALWHRNILIGAGVWRDRGLCIPISRSHDGDLVSAVILRLGFAAPPRGSSNRAGSALFRELVRRMHEDANVVVICDGPLGPARRSKPGTVGLARLSGAPVVPVAMVGTDSVLPRGGARPRFGKIVVRLGEPMTFPDLYGKRNRKPELEAVGKAVMARIAELQAEERELMRPPADD